MLVVYATRTGNIKRFIAKTNLENTFLIKTGDEKITEPYILLTYTASFGKIPLSVEKFLEKNNKFMLGIAGSGNRNWGDLYCNAVNLIKNKYSIKEIMRFELSGTKHEVEKFIRAVKEVEYEAHRTK